MFKNLMIAFLLMMVVMTQSFGAATKVPMSMTNFAHAVLKDVKSTGTQSGTFTSGAWQTRVLNTEVDPDGIVTLASNQFTLAAGTYFIQAYAPAYGCDGNQAKIRNITDSTDDIIGGTTYAVDNTLSVVLGFLTITSSKTYELQHKAQTTAATNGFGAVGISSGLSETYSQVMITRVK